MTPLPSRISDLNMDGTNVLLDNGKLAETYTIEDILSYSRAWTGFTSTSARGGVSSSGRQWTDTPFDPMEINVALRDLFPKTDLMNGYIGDRVSTKLIDEVTIPPFGILSQTLSVV